MSRPPDPPLPLPVDPWSPGPPRRTWLDHLRPTLRYLALLTMAVAMIFSMLHYGLTLLVSGTPPMTETLLGRLPAPGGAWIAVLKEFDKPFNLGGDTILATVSLAPAGDPGHSTPVLGVDTGGHADERPRVVWTAPDVLQVTVYARSFLKLLTRQVGPVHVDLRFDPPDPAARRDFLREMHMDPQPGE